MNCLAKTKYGAVFSTYFPPERGLVVSHCKAAGWNCSISRNPAWANEDEWNLTSNLHFNLIVASPTGDAPVLSASVGGNAGGVTVPPAVKPSVFHGAPAPGPFPLQTTAPTTVSVPPAVLPAHPVPQIPTATQTYANGLSVNAPGVGMYMGGSVQRPMFAYPPTPAHASAAPAGTWGGAYVPGWAFTQPAVGAHGFARGRYQ
uniref:Uncharacterized protein n=2 Tax=Chromera velia CCMP2878 TaxID=1169474 RepID=A0A0K6S9V8_9ALVE|eukprot:Cvel_8915.t1-p1 / transcript=Cvel_8915.t1 / gene=Cvel_8915 / organism=Chromera_velia_CCMP2878 / gene_product=hypothetical protein / transcript_product=hypothetical protein / location=Cvel_scaffold502:5613-6215(-) / protein_length=201 / sequence_SO=supercontig / SO=protein_coding / is_pseudo=false